MNSDSNIWKLDPAVEKRLTFLVLQFRAECRLTLDGLVKKSGYPGSPKTLHHHLCGRTHWTPHAVRAMAKLLAEDEGHRSPEEYIARLKTANSSHRAGWNFDTAIKPWQPRLRDVASMLKTIDRLERTAAQCISYCKHPPLWLMP